MTKFCELIDDAFLSIFYLKASSLLHNLSELILQNICGVKWRHHFVVSDLRTNFGHIRLFKFIQCTVPPRAGNPIKRGVCFLYLRDVLW